jgi:hypothetical protein
MYAWRARIGLIKPTHRGKSFHFWYKRAPDGVEIVPTFVGFRRSDRQTFENAFERIEQIADDLKEVGCQLISISGTPPVLLKNLAFEREWRDRRRRKLVCPWSADGAARWPSWRSASSAWRSPPIMATSS